LRSITPKEATDVVLCWGWIDGRGRWDRAYESGKDMQLPLDLIAAIDAEPKAKKMLATLNAQNRYALAFRVHNMKTDAGRKKRIEALLPCSSAARRSTRSARHRVSRYSMAAISRRIAPGSRGLRTIAPWHGTMMVGLSISICCSSHFR
jgi:hypothetical protein